MRGSAPARIDDKGRLKVPTLFRPDIQDRQGPDVFVTSLTGDCVRIYPMPCLARDRTEAVGDAQQPSLASAIPRPR